MDETDHGLTPRIPDLKVNRKTNEINDLPTPHPRQCWLCVPPVIALKTRGPRVQIGYQTQRAQARLACKNAGAVIRPAGYVCLTEAGFLRATADADHVAQRPIAALGGGNNFARPRHNRCHQDTHWVIGTGRATGAYAQILLGTNLADTEEGGKHEQCDVLEIHGCYHLYSCLRPFCDGLHAHLP
jgi:hypothetical protein